jgi:AcrR family transcriptional regulator
MTVPGGRTGRPPLTGERRAEIRLRIAHAAVHLFVEQGVTATTGDQIGQAVGVSARTLWRYFPNKESCVSPLFSEGIQAIAACLRHWSDEQPLEQLLGTRLAPGPGITDPSQRTPVTRLIRLTRTEPGLRAVWLQAYDEAEPAFAGALAERAGLPPEDLRPLVWAAMLNAALRTAVEHYVWHSMDPRDDPAATETELMAVMRAALVIAAEGVR